MILTNRKYVDTLNDTLKDKSSNILYQKSDHLSIINYTLKIKNLQITQMIGFSMIYQMIFMKKEKLEKMIHMFVN